MMKKLCSAALVAALSASVGCSHGAAASGGSTTPAVAPAATATTATATSGDHEAELRRLTVAELAEFIDHHEQVAVFDNNNPQTYATGHIPGARWVAHDGVTASILPADHGARLVFYCHNEQCQACHHAARQAMALGYTNVYILPAGIVGWQGAGKPVVAGQNPT